MGEQPAELDQERRRHEVDDWLASARSDLVLARDTVERQPEGVDPAAVTFHAQQAVEKAVKALLIQRQVRFPHTHEVGVLRALLPADVGSLLDERADDLTPYATRFRYPRSSFDPMDLVQAVDWDDAREAAAIAESVVATLTAAVRARPTADDEAGPDDPAPDG